MLCRIGSPLCAPPLGCVVETMRPLPIEAIPGTPDFIAGMAIVRGAAVPVIAMERLFDEPNALSERFILINVGKRRVALAVTEVIGIRTLADDVFDELPPLLGKASRDAVAEIGTLDGELVLLLETARIVPDHVFAALDREAAVW